MSHQTRLRSLYRRLLRELPSQPPAAALGPQKSKPSILSHPSPIKHRIRSSFSSNAANESVPEHRLQETEQFIQYLKAQRTYATLIERYNPGMNMDEEERVRLSARRVGMDLPVEFEVKPFGDGKG